MRTLIFILFIFLPGVLSFAGNPSTPGVTLYTPYTKISVPPGQSIDYTIDVINNRETVRDVAVYLTGIPKDWDYELKSGGWSVSTLSVLPGEKESLSLRVDVPFKVKKGTYRFNLVAQGLATLPLTVTVSEEGTFKTEFTTTQPNMEGNANASFTFNAELKNRTGEQQLYSLRAKVPAGWNASFKTGGRQVTSIQVNPNETQNVTVQLDPPDAIAAGAYKIPVTAVTSATSANLELEVVVTGSYEMELTTPTGLLSTRVTAGDEKRIALQIKNTGSAALKGVALSASAPTDWDVIFDPKEVEQIEPGKSAQVFATIRAYKKAIPGDYVTNLQAKTDEVTAKASFRVSVETSMLFGWIGLLVIGGASSGVYYLFRKYGRR